MKIKYTWTNHLFNFLAVILGVYLAFFINEVAKSKQDRQESILLMKSFVMDLSKDIEKYEKYTVPVNIEYQQQIATLLNDLSTNNWEDIENQLPLLFQVENRTPTTSTYTSMKASGKFNLIEDLSMQKKLTDYYDGLVPESEKKGEYQVDYFTNELLSWITNNIDLLTMEIPAMQDLFVLRNKLFIYESLIDQKVKSYEMIIEDSRELKKDINAMLTSK